MCFCVWDAFPVDLPNSYSTFLLISKFKGGRRYSFIHITLDNEVQKQSHHFLVSTQSREPAIFFFISGGRSECLPGMSPLRHTLERQDCDSLEKKAENLEKHAEEVKESVKMVGDCLAALEKEMRVTRQDAEKAKQEVGKVQAEVGRIWSEMEEEAKKPEKRWKKILLPIYSI